MLSKLTTGTGPLNVVTALVIVMAIIVVFAGAVVTIVRPDSLTFHAYVLDVVLLAGALGIGAGIGSGVTAAVKANNGHSDDSGETG